MSNHKHSLGLAKPVYLYPISIDYCLDSVQLWLKTPASAVLLYWELYLHPTYRHLYYPNGFLVKPNHPMNPLEESLKEHYEEYIQKAKNIIVKEML